MILPKGWKRHSLDEVATIQTGVAKNDSVDGDIVDVAYLRVANVQDGFVDLSEMKTIKIAKDRVGRYLLQNGDVLLTEGGDFDKLGRGTVWQGQISPCIHQNHVFVARPDTAKLTPEFLSAQTGSDYGKRYFRLCSKQSTNLASINSSQLKEFPVILPPLFEQKAIADLLSTWDKAIEKTERLIAAKEKQFQWLIDELITKPSKSGKWNEVKLNKILIEGSKDPVIDTRHHSKITIKLRKKGIERSDSSREMADTRPFYIRRKGEIIIGKQNYFNGSVAIVGDEFDGCICSNAIMSFEVKPEVCKEFLFEAISTNDFLKRREMLANGTGQKELSEKAFLNFDICLPSFNEQLKISHTLLMAQKEIELLKSGLEKTAELKRGLMQKLLNGQWRVKGFK